MDIPQPADKARSEVLVQTTYEAIKAAILSNHLRPGHKLGHQILAEKFGVSRTPVRESLERLYQEGYVTRVVNRGYFVAEIDAQEVRDLYETREALESYALSRLVVEGLSASASARINEINQRYRELCVEPLSRDRLLVDREFHLSLATEAGNRHLVRALEGIFDRLILKRRVEGYHDMRGLAPWEDHCRLLDALARKDAPGVARVLHEHIQSACSRFLIYLLP